jgi:hypothetical protein
MALNRQKKMNLLSLATIFFVEITYEKILRCEFSCMYYIFVLVCFLRTFGYLRVIFFIKNKISGAWELQMIFCYTRPLSPLLDDVVLVTGIRFCRTIERERDWCNVVDDCIEPLRASIYRRTDLKAKKALLEIWQDINYH